MCLRLVEMKVVLKEDDAYDDLLLILNGPIVCFAVPSLHC